MIFELRFHVTSQHIRIEAPQVGFSKEISNAIAIDKDKRFPVAIGETEEEIRQQINDEIEWQKFKEHVIFQNVFIGDNLDQPATYAVFEYFFAIAYDLARGSLSFWTQVFWDRFSYDFWIEGYEQIPGHKRKNFEYALLLNYQAYNLCINGVSSELPYWRRWAAKRTYFIADQVPLFMMIFSFPILFRVDGISDTILASILTLLAIAAPGTLALSIWMLLFRKLLPREYLRLIIFTPNRKGLGLTKRLADIFLKPEA